MRISDWSSDVCSSDLDNGATVVAFLKQLNQLARRVNIPVSGGKDTVIIRFPHFSRQTFSRFRNEIIETNARKLARNVLREAASSGNDPLKGLDFEFYRNDWLKLVTIHARSEEKTPELKRQIPN